MIGLEEVIRERNIHINNLSEEIEIKHGRIWNWFRGARIPNKYVKILSEKLGVDEDYLTRQVNDIDTYKPKGTKNEYVINGDKTIMIVNSKKGGRIDVEIDTDELEVVKDLSWFARLDRGRYYITTTLAICDIETKKYMTRNLALTKLIMRVNDKNIKVDHKSGDSLKNCKDNLRCASNSSNLHNRQRGKNKNNKTGYRNVIVDKASGKYKILLCINNKRFRVGKLYTDVHEAGKDAEIYRQQYYGEFAGVS